MTNHAWHWVLVCVGAFSQAPARPNFDHLNSFIKVTPKAAARAVPDVEEHGIDPLALTVAGRARAG